MLEISDLLSGNILSTCQSLYHSRSRWTINLVLQFKILFKKLDSFLCLFGFA